MPTGRPAWEAVWADRRGLPVGDGAVCRSWDGDAFVMWLPLLLISETGMWLGVDGGGEWVLGRLQGIVSSGRSLPQSWLTVLDADEADFRERLANAASRWHLPVEALQENVPVDEILAMAFRSRSPHWVERAMCWLINRNSEESYLESLRELATARWPNQWTRATAKRFSK